ncbi:uncharacterized protein N7483_007128, partial [Penicillium malachiteum]|uniref:uncharacterized protein n=1 Tax=Penicillium malachiteum TaxID=1324776 RepID=UPI002547DD16
VMSLTNIYHLRRVADTSAKSCLICYKPSTSVLITPDNKDFFYVCPAHLQDRHFCTPIVDKEGEAKRQKEEALAKEIEKVKQEYEEKQRRKKEKAKDEKDKDKDDSKDKDKSASDSKTKDEKERDDKIDSIKNASSDSDTKPDNSPRIFELHKNFYQMRIDRLRSIEMAKRNQERMKNPSLFPSVPTREI